MLQLVENARAAAKEIDKRLLPILKEQKAELKKIQKWMQVRDALNYVTENPVAGARLLAMRTGSDSIREVIDMIGMALEGSVKMAK